MTGDEFVPFDALPYLTVRTAQALEQRFSTVIATEGLTVRHFGIISRFARTPVLTAATLARALEVTPQSIGPQIDVLVARGLIQRTPRRGRGRPIELTLTDAGRATLARALEIARAENARLTGHMTAAQQRTMHRQLTAMKRRAGEP